MQYLLRIDRVVFRGINSGLRCFFLDKIMPFFTYLGGAIFSCAVALLMLFVTYRTNSIGKETLFALSGSHLAVQIIKRFVSRARPYEVMEEVNTWDRLLLKDYSFPSGHTAASFSISTVIAINYHFLAPFVLALAALVGLSRIYTGLHYPTDVLIGAVLGSGFALVACF